MFAALECTTSEGTCACLITIQPRLERTRTHGMGAMEPEVIAEQRHQYDDPHAVIAAYASRTPLSPVGSNSTFEGRASLGHALQVKSQSMQTNVRLTSKNVTKQTRHQRSELPSILHTSTPRRRRERLWIRG